MYFLIVDTRTNQKYKKPGHFCAMSYATQQGARTAATKLNRKATSGGIDYVAMSEDQFDYYYPVKMKKVRNLMSGVEIEIAEDTPLCCDPSSETYWSM